MNRYLRYVCFLSSVCSFIGCSSEDHEVAWMPDSSGLLYRKTNGPVSDVMRFDLERRATRSLVVGDATFTCLPGISPDGKKMAFAKIGRSKQKSTVQISIYGIDGDHESTSDEFSAAGDDLRVGIQQSSIHWSVDGTHLIVLSDQEIVGVFDVRTNVFRKSPRLYAPFDGQVVATPDGKGFLASHPRRNGPPFAELVFIDWDGWEHAFTVEATDLKLAAGGERFASWSRNGTKLVVEQGNIRTSIDISAHSVSYDEISDYTQGRGVDEMVMQAFFSAGKACVVVRNPGKPTHKSQGDVLSVRLMDQNKSRELLSDIAVQWFKVAPNDQMVAVMYVKNVEGGMERRILIVKDTGEILADILREHVQSPAAKPQQNGSVEVPADTPTIAHWKSYRRTMNKYLPIVESPDRTKAREACSSLVQELTAIPTKDVDPLLVKLTADGASLFRDRLAGDKYLTSPEFLINGALQGAAGDPLASSREANALSEQIRTRMADYTRRFPETVAALSKKHGIDFMEIK